MQSQSKANQIKSKQKNTYAVYQEVEELLVDSFVGSNPAVAIVEMNTSSVYINTRNGPYRPQYIPRESAHE